MNAPIEHGLEATAPAQTRPPVFLNDGNPLAIIAACKRVARRAGMSLDAWCEFASTAWACLTPECAPEEVDCFLRIVGERFTVTKGPRFSWDPSTWRIVERPPDD